MKQLEKSTTGYAVYLNGDLITWRSNKQNHLALSSAEAEFISTLIACKEVVSLREMYTRILVIFTLPIMCEDNKAVIELAMNENSLTFKHPIFGDLDFLPLLNLSYTPSRSDAFFNFHSCCITKIRLIAMLFSLSHLGTELGKVIGKKPIFGV